MYLAKTLIQGSALTTSAVVYYTTPTGVSTRISQMSVVNNDSVARTVTIYAATGTGAPATADLVVKAKTLQPGETWVPYAMLGLVLEAGRTIQALASAGAVVVLKASGVELT